jgi:uncharacterized protein (UPF0332 family)
MIDAASIYFDKADESLAGAESELGNRRYNNCANRCYYACFQAAISALLQAGIHATSDWGHEFVQAQFVGHLINRRKLYAADLPDVLSRTLYLRLRADYTTEQVSQAQIARAVRNTRRLLEALQQGGATG